MNMAMAVPDLMVVMFFVNSVAESHSLQNQHANKARCYGRAKCQWTVREAIAARNHVKALG
jgi:hypothetical protein